LWEYETLCLAAGCCGLPAKEVFSPPSPNQAMRMPASVVDGAREQPRHGVGARA